MESQALLGLVDQLDGNLGQLEDALGPILEESLNATSKKLPLLDRAKLNITVVYAIESLIFSYLKVNGVDPKNHAIFKEIERVKQYFNKIKEAEEKPVVTKPSTTLNKQAAARIIQHSLAGNGSSDLTQREREARERLMLKLKQRAESSTPVQTPKEAPIETAPAITPEPLRPSPPERDVDMQQEDSSAEEGEIDEEEVPAQAPEPQQPITTIKEPQSKKRKQKQSSDNSSKLSKKARKKAKKEAKIAANGGGNTG